MDKTSVPEFWPGPMEGVAQSGFVAAANELDLVSRWMTPFLRISDNIPSRGRIDRFLAPFLASGKPVVLQLMGDDPEKLAAGAKIAVEAGAEGINLNCGCPSRRVVRHRAGGGTLHAPSVVGNIAKEIKNAIGEHPFSLKFRAGERDWREMEVFLPEWLATKCIDLLFFHCRTVAEKYDPVPGREARFARAAELAGDVPLILNGDLDGGAETFFLLQKCRARGAMFARNWMRDPFLLRRCEKKAAPDPETGRKEFFRVFCSKNPPRGAKLEIARMLWGVKSPEFREVLTKG